MQRGIVVMPTAILTACGELGKSGHRNKDIKATIINISERDSRQGHIVVAESLSVSTNGVKVAVSHGFLGSQAFLKKKKKLVKLVIGRGDGTYGMVISQKLVKEVNSLITDESLVLSVDK